MEWTQNDSFDSWEPSGDDSGPKKAAMPKIKVMRKKRRFDKFYGEPPAKRAAPSIRLGAGFKWNLQTLANAADAVESGGKSPVSALNELGVKVHYTVLRQGGPAHCPSFTVAVTVADMTFEGWGHSKREARASAARACLAALLARAGRVLPAPSQNQDFTSDEPANIPVSDFQCLESKMTTPPPVVTPVTNNNGEVKNGTTNGNVVPARPSPPPSSPTTALFGSTVVPPANKSPINVLYENYSGLVFTCTFGDGSPLDASQAPLQLSHSMRFKVVCQIKDQKYEGYGSSKKLAKLAAARSALAALDEGRADNAPASVPAGALHQTLADHIGKLVNEKFNELMKNDLVHSKRKVLAGIVLTINNRIDDARVIAVTTGTKCVSGEHMSVTGRAVNDCHAEVAARRCLQRHLYAQLLMYANQPDPRTPIEECDIEPSPPGGYRMKADRQLHLYISTAPCGDGRIFSPHEQQDAEPDKHPNRLARGQLRTKIESGEGTIPVKNCNNVVQTWDGVMQGERLLTMSCSDKVARWCVAGLQGSLLSRLIAPVYLHSLVLGSLLHPHHMYRAICGRIEAYISSLPPPFRLHRPLLARAASTEARTPARAPSFSVCWCATTPLPEVINATTGKLESGQPSLICKQSMFARWQYLIKRLSHIPQETDMEAEPAQLPASLDGLLYNEAKQLCPTYQIAKNRLIDAFEKAKLGRWIKKPIEQDQFVCEITSADQNALFAWAGVYPRAWDSMANVVGASGQSGIDGGQSQIDGGQSQIENGESGRNFRYSGQNKSRSESYESQKFKLGSGQTGIECGKLSESKHVINKESRINDKCYIIKNTINSFDNTDNNKRTNNNNYYYVNSNNLSVSNIDNKYFITNLQVNLEKPNSYAISRYKGTEIKNNNNSITPIEDIITNKLKTNTNIACSNAQISDENKIINDTNYNFTNVTNLVDVDKNTQTKTSSISNILTKIGSNMSPGDDDFSIEQSNLSINNQSLFKNSHLVTKNSIFNNSIGRGRGRLNILLHNKTKIGSDVDNSTNISNINNNSSVGACIKNSISNFTLEDNNKSDLNENLMKKDKSENTEDRSLNGIQERFKNVTIDDNTKRYWRQFYRNRNEKRTTIDQSTSSNDTVLNMIVNEHYKINNSKLDIDNIKSESVVSEINTAKTNTRVSTKDNSQKFFDTKDRLADNSTSRQGYTNYDVKTRLKLREIEKVSVNLDKGPGELIENTDRGLVDLVEVEKVEKRVELGPKKNKFNLYISKYREIDKNSNENCQFNDFINSDKLNINIDNKENHSTNNKDSSIAIINESACNKKYVELDKNATNANNSDDKAQNTLKSTVLIRKLNIYKKNA